MDRNSVVAVGAFCRVVRAARCMERPVFSGDCSVSAFGPSAASLAAVVAIPLRERGSHATW